MPNREIMRSHIFLDGTAWRSKIFYLVGVPLGSSVDGSAKLRPGVLLVQIIAELMSGGSFVRQKYNNVYVVHDQMYHHTRNARFENYHYY